MGKILFVSGIDTDAGKSVATGLLARDLLRRGIRAITIKLVQTGNPPGFSEDRALHRKMMGGVSFPEDAEGLTAPQIFSFPSSPHFAAALEGREVDVEAIRSAVRTVAARYDVTLVEGAGGLAVPLTESLLTVDLAREEKWPTILVTSGKLGSLNHTILSIDALLQRDLRIAGVLYNRGISADEQILRDTERMIRLYLQRRSVPPLVISIPKVDWNDLPDVDCSALWKAEGIL